MASPGQQARFMLQSTFDWVAPLQVVYLAPSGVSAVLRAIPHDEVLRNRREHLSEDNQGAILDLNSKRIIFKTEDIKALGIDRLDPKGCLFIGGIRYDFSTREPFLDDDITPFAGASGIFTVAYLRRAQETILSLPVPDTQEFGFDSWSLE